MHLKITTQKELLPHFQNMFFCDFWQDYDNLNVTIDPNLS